MFYHLGALPTELTETTVSVVDSNHPHPKPIRRKNINSHPIYLYKYSDKNISVSNGVIPSSKSKQRSASVFSVTSSPLALI